MGTLLSNYIMTNNNEVCSLRQQGNFMLLLLLVFRSAGEKPATIRIIAMHSAEG
jgi:hypothetical protein